MPRHAYRRDCDRGAAWAASAAAAGRGGWAEKRKEESAAQMSPRRCEWLENARTKQKLEKNET